MKRAHDKVLGGLRQQVVFPAGRQVVVPVVVGRSWFLSSALMIVYVRSADVIEERECEVLQYSQWLRFPLATSQSLACPMRSVSS